MKRFIFEICSICLVCFTYTESGKACSAFSLPNSDEKLVSKSFDWKVGHGLVFFNKRGVEKVALINQTIQQQPIKWISRFGSMTFNQHGQEMPMSGMNEKGLVAEILMLTETVYPQIDSRPAINEVQWIQYQLDNFSSVTEVVANADLIRVSPSRSLHHFFVCDAQGTCASIEFLNGTTKIHYGSNMPINAMTNTIYENGLNALSDYEGFGGTKPIPQGMDSLERFIRVAALSKQFNPLTQSAVEYSFNVLESVHQYNNWTKWHLVYDTVNKIVYFRTADFFEVREIAINQGDFNCHNPVQIIDMNGLVTGDNSLTIKTYSKEINRRSIKMAFAGDNVPEDRIDRLANYPDSMVCRD